jgi:hypothetical protein
MNDSIMEQLTFQNIKMGNHEKYATFLFNLTPCNTTLTTLMIKEMCLLWSTLIRWNFNISASCLNTLKHFLLLKNLSFQLTMHINAESMIEILKLHRLILLYRNTWIHSKEILQHFKTSKQKMNTTYIRFLMSAQKLISITSDEHLRIHGNYMMCEIVVLCLRKNENFFRCSFNNEHGTHGKHGKHGKHRAHQFFREMAFGQDGTSIAHNQRHKHLMNELKKKIKNIR